MNIEKGKISDLDVLFAMYRKGKAHLERQGIFQWTDKYPTISIIERDLDKGYLYVLSKDEEILGAVNLSEEQEDVYINVSWQYNDAKILVIHRLIISPEFQNQGYGKVLMDYAEGIAKENSYSSIRLDVYSQNTKVIDFYKKRAYIIRGNVSFSGRKYEFHCMEKKV